MKRVLFVAVVLGCLFMLARLFVPSMVERRQNHILQPGPYHASADAEALHRTLLVADLHADTLLWGRNLLEPSHAGNIDVPRMLAGNVALQAFTVVSTVPRNLNIDRNDDSSDVLPYLGMAQGWPLKALTSPKQRALYQAKRMQQFVDKSNGALILLKTRGDLASFLKSRAGGSHVIAAFLGTEGAQPLEGKLENLNALYTAGFRMMVPTHFTDIAIGGAAAGAGRGGLTPLGREWVRQMESRGMVIDLAHASPATLREVTAMATKPVIVSHTGVKGVCDNNRNLSDDELRAVAATGGVIGVGFWEVATCGQDANAIATAIRYTAGVVGAEHVALGSDFDGAVTEPFDASGLVLITEALLQQGVSERDIRLIMGENVARVLSQTLPE
ncbi:MAG TPA: membrane dipeptidase [Terriglobales bacterium]